jgi:Skp family chaperone for outer membrane proteins
MNKPTPPSKAPSNGDDATENLDKNEAAGPGNVDKIRDILFGSQMRDYEKRFARFEERLLKETADLREDMKRRFASLEAYVRNEMDALSDRLKSEQSERLDAVKEIARELKENTKGLEKKAGQLEDQAAKSQRDLRQHILEEFRRLSEEIEQKHGDVATSLKKESQELRAILIDRLALADLFAEMALRLKDEFEIPGQK